MLWRAGGEGRGRAAGRAGLCSQRKGGRARAGAASSLSPSLARSLPPSAGGFSQPACSRRAAEGRSLGRRRRLLPLFVGLKLLLARPGATGEARRAREGARGSARRAGGGRGAGPEGTVRAAAEPPQPLSPAPPAGPGAGVRAHTESRGARGRDAAWGAGGRGAAAAGALLWRARGGGSAPGLASQSSAWGVFPRRGPRPVPACQSPRGAREPRQETWWAAVRRCWCRRGPGSWADESGGIRGRGALRSAPRPSRIPSDLRARRIRCLAS